MSVNLGGHYSRNHGFDNRFVTNRARSNNNVGKTGAQQNGKNSKLRKVANILHQPDVRTEQRKARLQAKLLEKQKNSRKELKQDAKVSEIAGLLASVLVFSASQYSANAPYQPCTLKSLPGFYEC